jgi:hypothetical protein
VGEQVKVLALVADAVGASEPEGVVEGPVDRLGVATPCVEAGEVGVARRNWPDALGPVETW